MTAPDGVRIRARRLRRYVGIAAAAVLAAVLALNGIAAIDAPQSAAAPAASASAVQPGTGSSVAQTIKVNPTAASLSIGVSIGQALAGHQNKEAQAESNPVDLGVIGTTLTTGTCGKAPTIQPSALPQPLRISSQSGSPPKSATGSLGGAVNESVKVNDTPFAEATTSTAPIGLPGVLQIGPGTATATSGLVNGQRVATATVDIGAITIAGLIALKGLHWQARYSTGTKTSYAGSFTIGALTVGGVPVPLVSPTKALATLNKLLASLGIKIEVPTAHLNGDTLFVDPLAIAVVPNKQRDAITGALLNAIQPITQPLFDALVKNGCALPVAPSTAITVFDVAVGAISGAGSFSLELGGVQCTTGSIKLSQYLGGGLGDATPEVSAGAAPSGSTGGGSLGGGSSNLGSVGGSPSVVAPGPTALSGNQPAAPAPTTPVMKTKNTAADKLLPGHRGGALAAVAGGVLGLVLLLGEADRRKMRKAQRQIPVGF